MTVIGLKKNPFSVEERAALLELLEQVQPLQQRIEEEQTDFKAILEEARKAETGTLFCSVCFQPECFQHADYDLPLTRKEVIKDLEVLLEEYEETLTRMSTSSGTLNLYTQGDLKMDPKPKKRTKKAVSTAKPPKTAAQEAASKAVAAKTAAKSNPAPKVVGAITLKFNDRIISQPDPKTARKWLRKEGFSVKAATKDEADPSIWVFADDAPVPAPQPEPTE